MSFRRLIVLPAALALLAHGALAAAEGRQAAIVEVPYGELVWEETPEGVAFAALHGARFEEAYMAMVRLPPGTVSPLHVKSAAMHGMVISGTMTHVARDRVDAAAVELAEGSYYAIPANVPHVSSCVSDTPCVTFLYQDGKFDFIPLDVGQ